MDKQSLQNQEHINIQRKMWNAAARRLYLRRANSFEVRKKNKRWPPFEKLSEYEKDFWRGSAQAYAQNYPTIYKQELFTVEVG